MKVFFLKIYVDLKEYYDCSRPGGDGHGETDYLCGYQIVKDMTDTERDDIIKYNIGPSHIKRST